MNIVLIGYGRMGKAIAEVARARGHSIVLTIESGQEELFDSALFASADVAIEFTGPTTAKRNCLRALDRGLAVVCGSTGFMTPELRADIEGLCRDNGRTFFYASNFSVGVNILFALNRRLARLMNSHPEYQAQLSETHHIHKLDAPSGTAITLAQELIESSNRYKSWLLGHQGGLPDDILPIEAHREAEVPGIHEVVYRSAIDSISLRHEAFGRGGFALGAILAAEYTMTHHGMLSMNELLSIDN